MAVAVGWSAAGVLLCVALVVDSLLPGGPRLPGVLVFVGIVGVVPAFFVATAVVIAGKPRGRKAQTEWFVLLWRMPRRAKVGLGVPGG